jgi:ubiquinone/menaquinone biosynthesis C-methylase UbiE
MTSPAKRPTFPEMYERELVAPLFRPCAEIMVEQAAIAPGERVLDLACGTGVLARLVNERYGGQAPVTGVDASGQMLAVARSIAPEIEWREAKAGGLPAEFAGAFDVVLCQQGLQFFPDKPAAMREVRRALAPGGRVVIATWRPVEETPFLLEMQRAAERHVGAIADPRHSFGDDRAIAALLSSTGFREVRVETVA